MSDDCEHQGLRIPYPKIGMRTVKTVLAVFICCVIDFMRGELPYQSTIAAILCMQPDTENSIKVAGTRILATLTGGSFAAITLLVVPLLGMHVPSIPYYLALSLLLFPLIYLTVRVGWPSATALSCVVFLVISLGYTEGSIPIIVAGNRVLDTLIGILVALPVNLLLPNHQKSSCAEEAEAAPPQGKEPDDSDSDNSAAPEEATGQASGPSEDTHTPNSH